MFDIGWTEMLVIGVIAIVVVGPKDLPRMLRTVGQYVGKAKRMAREFQTQFDDAVKDTELDDVRKSFNDLKSSNPTGEVGKALNPFKDAADDLKKTVEDSDKADWTDPGAEDENAIAGISGPADTSKSADDAEPAKSDPAPETGAASEAAPDQDKADVEPVAATAAETGSKAATANG